MKPGDHRFDVGGRTAVITGAASGLGRAFALALSVAGARVIGVDCDANGLARTGNLAEAQGTTMTNIPADVSDESAVDAMLQAITGHTDKVDILVNNAGITIPPGRIHEISAIDWDRTVATNLRSMFLVTRALLPMMMRQGYGSIINLSSILGLVGAYPGFPVTAVPYAASKAGVIGFTRQLAIEYSKDGIRANVIAPGWHGGTDLGREARARFSPEQGQRFENYIAESVPMGRRGTPEELCGLLLYLASDASCYMTGQILSHDGGLAAA